MIRSSVNKNIKLLIGRKECAYRVYSEILDVCHEVFKSDWAKSWQLKSVYLCHLLQQVEFPCAEEGCWEEFQPGFLSFNILTLKA